MIAPTARAAALAAAGAPLGLALGLVDPERWWLALLWLALLLVVGVSDAVFLVSAKDVTAAAAAPASVAVGETFFARIAASAPSRLSVLDIALTVDPHLQSDGDGFARVQLRAGSGEVTLTLTARRRGAVQLGPVDLRWTGRLGLVARVKRQPADRIVMILPDIRAVAKVGAALLAEDSRLGVSLQPWRGDSGVFEALTEFRDGVDRRRIDWKASARHATLLAKEHTVERDNAIVLAVDCGRLMCEPIDDVARVDRAVSAALLAGYAALKLGDRVGFFAFDARPRHIAAPRGGIDSFAALQRTAASIDYSFEETNFALSLSELGKRLDRRSLIILFTDFVDTTTAELMLRVTGRLRRRHLVVAVVFQDAELEGRVAGEPRESDDIARAVMAAGLLQERRLVLARLRQIGIDVIEAAYRESGPALVRHYLDLKARRRV